MIAQASMSLVHGGHRPPWITLILSLAMVALFHVSGPASATWVFDRAAILDGEVWRLITGHLVHSDREHLQWNLAAFLILGGMAETVVGLSRHRFLTTLLAGGMAISASILWFLPGLDFYCGLSGVLNTLLAVLLVAGWTRTESLLFPLIGAGAAAKIVVEAWLGTAPFTATSWPPLPLAHAVGMAAGLILAYAAIVPSFELQRENGAAGVN